MNPDLKPNLQLAVPFFGVSDIEASLRFYTEGLGFIVTRQWKPRGKIEWCWLERDSVALMLQEPRVNEGQFSKPKYGPSICVQCADALALYHEFKGRGLAVREPFVGNGFWVVALADPDGYHLEFESLTDAPEEINYRDWVKSGGKG